MSIIPEQHLFFDMLCEFGIWLKSQGYKARLGDAYRSTDKLCVPGGDEGFDDDDKYSYQELLFYNKKSKVTYGKHSDRLAIDLIIEIPGSTLTDEQWRSIGEKWESMGGKWGGRFGVKANERDTKIGWDRGHFEL